MTSSTPDKQLLHLVIGGELKQVGKLEFANLKEIDFVGAFPSYKAAYDAWKGAAQRGKVAARRKAGAGGKAAPDALRRGG